MTTWFFSLQTDTFYSKIKVRLDAVPFFLHTEPAHGKRGLHHANPTTTAFERPPCGGPVLHPAARLRARWRRGALTQAPIILLPALWMKIAKTTRA